MGIKLPQLSAALYEFAIFCGGLASATFLCLATEDYRHRSIRNSDFHKTMENAKLWSLDGAQACWTNYLPVHLSGYYCLSYEGRSESLDILLRTP